MENGIRIVREASEPKEPVDVTRLIIKFSQQYRNVYAVQYGGGEYTFVFRALGRGEFKQILEDPRFDDYKKEEIICSQCLLYPDPDTFEWDNTPAGIASELKKKILHESYLDSMERRSRLHDFYRAEMYNIDNEITCIINEAFPNIDIEEIEQWDVEKTTKYLSRAEWKLQNLRGIPLEGAAPQNDYGGTDSMEMGYQQPQEERQERQRPPKKDDSGKTIRGGERKNKLTPEKLKEQAEFLKKFPQFANDSIIEAGGIEGMEQAGVDVSPALRVGW